MLLGDLLGAATMISEARTRPGRDGDVPDLAVGVPACEDLMNLPRVRAVAPDSRPSVPPGVTRDG